MKKPALIVTIIAIASLSLVGGVYLNQQLADRDKPTQGTPKQPTTSKSFKRPDYSLRDVEWKLRHASEWDGKVVMVNFWATWCPPCRREMPAFVKLQEAYRDKGFVIIGIAIDTLNDVVDFIDPLGMNYPILIAEQEGIPLMREYGNRLGILPYTVFIDRKGNIVHTHPSELSYQEAEALIKPLL